MLAFSGLPTVIPIPITVGQLVTQGALGAALLLALLHNPHGVIRPNTFMVLLTLLAVVALMVSIHSEFMYGSTFRACRLLACSSPCSGCLRRGGAGRTSPSSAPT